MNSFNKLKIDSLKGKTIALILDGFINGLGVLRSLKDEKIDVVTLSEKGAVIQSSKYSNINLSYKDEDDFIEILLYINEVINLAIPYYCKDYNLVLLSSLKQKLHNYSIYRITSDIFEKGKQQEIAKKIGLLVPESKIIKKKADFDEINFKNKEYIIKPIQTDSTKDLFKTKISSDKKTLSFYAKKCNDSGVDALISEYIKGDDTHLLTFGGYSFKGECISKFTGRKISQRPRFNGVASIAESISDKELMKLGEKFIKEIDFTGIFQIEFKIDHSKNYYFIEFNPRNWSWGNVASKSGRNLPLAKFLTETNQKYIDEKIQTHNTYVWFEGVLYNLIIDKWFGILKTFFLLIFSKKTKNYAIFDKNDVKPFFYYIKNTFFYFLKLRKKLR